MVRSRLQRVRSRKAGKQGVMYLLIALVIAVAMIGWGIKGIASLAAMFTGADAGQTNQYELKPTPPIFADVPEATYSATVNVEGYAQPGVDVALYLNGAELSRKLTSDSGTFAFDNVPISEGENNIYGYSLTTRNLRSEKSKEYKIALDTTKPSVTIDSPRDGEILRGQTQRIVTFAGGVNEEGSKVYVGERMVIVQAEGRFTLPYQMIEGDQEVTIRAIDKAGNENVSSLKLWWEP